MSTRRPPVAPKTGQQPIGPVEGQQIVLESHSPSPRKGGLSEYVSLGLLRPRSPKPMEVYSAAIAEVGEGDGRIPSKASKPVASSPASSPSRRRGSTSLSSINMASSIALNSLSPRTSSSILDQPGTAAYKTMTFTGVNGPSHAISSASARVLSALDEHRVCGGSNGSQDRLYCTAPLPGTPTRKATSAPDSQSTHAQMRTSMSPWSNGKDSLVAQNHLPISVAAGGGQSMGAYNGPTRGRSMAPPSPPMIQNLAFPSTSPPPPPPLGYAGHAPVTLVTPLPVPPPAPAGPVRQRRESISSTDSHSPIVMYDSPATAFSSSLRVTTLSRIGSPHSGSSTPSSSQPHTPVNSSLKPKPPPGCSETATGGRGSARKVSHLASPDLRRQQHQQQPLPHAHMQLHQIPAAQYQHQQQAGGCTAREEQQLMHMATAPGTVVVDEGVLPLQPVFRRSQSMGSAGGGGPAPGPGPGPPLTGSTPRDSSQPGTPTSNSNSNSNSRPNSGRCTRQPVALLVDAVRSKDEGKLAEVLEALRGPQGLIAGLNERHPVTGRTPLHEAVTTSSPALVWRLLQAGANPNICHPSQGPPLLHSAAYGDVEVMRMLLDESADVNAVDAQRDTALHLACVGAHVEAARLLTGYGALWNVINDDNQTPLQLAAPEFMRLYTYEQSRPSTQPSTMYLGNGVDGGGGGRGGAHTAVTAAATMAAAASMGGLCSDVSYGGVGVALSPERPSSTASSRPTSAATTPGLLRAASGALDSISNGGGGGRRMAGRPFSGPPATGSGCNSNSGSAGVSPRCGQPLSPTLRVDLFSSGTTAAAAGVGNGGSGSGSTALPPSGCTGSLRPVPPSEPVSGGGGFRSRRNSASSAGGIGPAPDYSPLVPLGCGASAAMAATAAAAVSNRVNFPASPQLPDSEGMPASPPMLQLPGGVRQQLSRGAGEGDILSAFQAEDAEIVLRSVPSVVTPGLGGPPLGSTGQSLGPVNGMAIGFFPPFQPPPGLPPGPSAALVKAKMESPKWGPRDHPGAHQHPHLPSFSLGSGQPQQPQPQQELPQLRINVPETSMIRFGVRLQVHGIPDLCPPHSIVHCSTPTLDTFPTPPNELFSAPDSLTPSDCTAASRCTEVTISATTTAAGGLSTTCSNASDASTATSSAAIHEAGSPPTPPLSAAIAMPSFSAGVAAAVVEMAAAVGSAAAVPADGGDEEPHDVMVKGNGHEEAAASVYTPVPATGFTPPPLTPRLPPTAPPTNEVKGGAGATAATVAAAAAAAAARRASGSGEDAGTPPLVRDSSPVRDCRASGEGVGVAAGSGPGGGGASGRGSERYQPQRGSILAATEALKRMSPVTTSKNAIEVRAANMFRQSIDLRTGEIQWTQGELIGEGAFGKVYVGLNQQTGELMAVKVMRLISHQMNKEAALLQLKDLEHEMSLYKKLRNKHVVGFIDARYDPTTLAYFIFLEYVPGGSISSMLKRFKRFSEELVRNYTRQLLSGLEYLHSCRVVHRDLKGGNVLVSRDGVVKLTDFGASKAYRDQTIKECMKSVRGSVYWMAPEVIRGTGYDRRADIWSLGCTVIEMLSGSHPWPHLDNQWTAMFTIAKCEEGPPRPVNISGEAAAFLDRCLQFDPGKRPTATELLQDPFVAQLPAAPFAVSSDSDARLQHSF